MAGRPKTTSVLLSMARKTHTEDDDVIPEQEAKAGIEGFTEGPADNLFNSIRKTIEHMQPGTRLPSERDIMSRYDVSRQTTRSVLTRLTREGLVERRAGSGTYVTEKAASIASNEPDREPDAGFVDVLEARRGLDPIIVELATERATPRDMAQLEAIIEQMQATKDMAEIKKYAYDFLMVLASASRNPILEASYRTLVQCRKNLGWDQLNWRKDLRKSRVSLIKQQIDVYTAIQQRDRFTAVSLVLEDLDRLQLLAMGPRVKRSPQTDDDEGIE